MKMMPVVLALLIALPVQADPIGTLDADPVLFVAPIKKGEPSPVDGRVLDTRSYIAVAQRTAAAEAERDALREGLKSGAGGPWLAILGAVALVIGAGLGFQAARLAPR